MAQTTLFRDTFTGASGPVSAHTPEVGSYIYPIGSLDGSGHVVPAAGGIQLETAPTATAQAGATYVAIIETLDSAIGVLFSVFGDYDPISDSDGGFLYTKLSSSDVLEYAYAGAGENGGPPSTATLTPAVSVGGRIELRFGPEGSSITIGEDVVVALPSFKSSDFGAGAIRMYVSGQPDAAAVSELALTEITSESGPGTIVKPEGVCGTKYGQIIAAYDVTVAVSPVEPSTRSGTPLAWSVTTQGVGTIHNTYGACTTVYGEPSAASPTSVGAIGASTTDYGIPAAIAAVTPAGSNSTICGRPTAIAICKVIGHYGTKYGTPEISRAYVVKGASTTKYGKVRAVNPDAHLVYGLNNGRRAGIPRAVEIP